MGQQQYFLIIVVTVIVAIGMAVAIGAIDETHTAAGKEAIRQDIVRALGDAQAYYYKPANLGGGGRSFSNLSIQDLSLEPSGLNGDYSLSTDTQSVQIAGEKASLNLFVEATATMNSAGSLTIEWNYDNNNGNGSNNGNSNNNGNGGNNGNSGNGNGNGGNNGNQGGPPAP